MQLIIASNDKTRHIPLPVFILLVVLCITTVSVLTSFMVGWWEHGHDDNHHHSHHNDQLNVSDSSNNKQQIDNAFYAKQLGEMQAEVIRLKIISKRLAKIAGINLDEYALNKPPAEGGMTKDQVTLSPKEIKENISLLSSDLSHQSNVLAILQQYETTRQNVITGLPRTNPVAGAWISSPFGPRIDPITGKQGFHPGIDLAAPIGTPVKSAADGIITRAGANGGYGNFIEVDHGNGYMTHYAHLEKILVRIGQHVKKGQKIGLLGSTGHSTGPHLHFEVVKNGKRINPYPFIASGLTH